MIRNAYYLAVCIALCAAACGRDEAPLPLPLDTTALTRFTSAAEWRDARRFDDPGAWELSLGAAQPGAVAFLSVLSESPLGIDLTLDAESIYANELSDGAWHDVRVELKASGECILTVTASGPFWMANVELREPSPAPDVLVVLIDTLRQDHVGCYGYGRDTTPNMDALAADGIVFTQLMPQSSWTKPSVASLLTGLYPAKHGAVDRRSILREGLPSLAEGLGEGGYATIGLMSNVNCIPYWGFGNDFGRYVDVNATTAVNYDDAQIVDVALQSIAFNEGRPSFHYVHCMGPHDPYDAPPPYRGRYASETDNAIDRYDEEIAYTDAQIGRIIADLKQRDRYDSTLIVLVSDHGEEFGEHGGSGHGKTLYEEQLRVPLIMKLPGNQNAGQRLDTLVEMVDIAPTILDLVGIESAYPFDGSSFAALIDSQPVGNRAGYAALSLESASQHAVKQGRHKFIQSGGGTMWFDLQVDPGEQSPAANPPENGDDMLGVKADRAMPGTPGLHIMITGDSDSSRAVSCTVEAPEVANGYVRTKATAQKISAANGTAKWSNDAAMLPIHLLFPLPIETTPRVTVLVDGQALPASTSNQGLGGEPLDLGLLQVDNLYWPDSSQAPSVYVWYVSPYPEITDAQLDPELRETLGAMGYLDSDPNENSP